MAEVVIFLPLPCSLLYGEAAACLLCEQRSWFSSAGDWKLHGFLQSEFKTSGPLKKTLQGHSYCSN